MLLFFSVVVVVVLSRGAVQSLFSQPSVSSLGRTEEREREQILLTCLKELCHEIGAQATSTERLLRRLRKRHLKSKLSGFFRLYLAFSVSFNSNVGKFLWI